MDSAALSHYVEGWRERTRAEEAIRAEREKELRIAAARAARVLAAHGACRVVLFGSVAKRRTHRASDIDLAAEGLAWDDYFRAWNEAERAAGVPVDLVRLEEADRPALRSAIEEGEVLVGR